MAVGGSLLSTGALDIVRCASHISQPLGFYRWSSDKWGHQTVRWCTGQSLFTVRCAICACSDFCACSPRTIDHCSPFADDRWRCSRYSAWHTGQSGATPDSPVNYSGEAPRKPKASKLELIHPGAQDTVRWHTGQSGAPDQGSLRFSLLLWFEPFLGLFIGLYWTFGTYRTYNLEQTS
jgi:hypothetical protein